MSNYPTIVADELRAGEFSATTGPEKGLSNVVFNLFLAGDIVARFALLNPSQGFAVSLFDDPVTIYGDTNSMVAISAMKSLIEQNGRVEISFADVDGTNAIKISFS